MIRQIFSAKAHVFFLGVFFCGFLGTFFRGTCFAGGPGDSANSSSLMFTGSLDSIASVGRGSTVFLNRFALRFACFLAGAFFFGIDVILAQT